MCLSGEAPGDIHPKRGSGLVLGGASREFMGASPEDNTQGPRGKRREPRVGCGLAGLGPGPGSLAGVLAGDQGLHILCCLVQQDSGNRPISLHLKGEKGLFLPN